MEANYKVLIRWCLVNSRVAKYVPTYSALCFRGCSDLGTHLHIRWTCPIAQTFWRGIFELAPRMFDLKLQLNPTTALLNLKPECLTHTQFKLFIQLLTAAKQMVAKAWKSPSLVIAETKHRMHNSMIYAKMVAIERDQIPKFEKLWHPWIKHHLSSTFNKNVLMPW